MLKIIILIFSLLFINSCEKVTSRDNSYSGSCKVVEQNRYVYNFMQENYLWYQDIPELDYTAYESPYALFLDLTVPKDKWSFIIDKKTFDDYFSGKGYVGYGFKFAKLNGRYYLQMVLKESPASKSNLQRGDEIVKIDGKEITSTDMNEVINLLGPREVGVSREFTIRKKDGSIVNVTLTKESVAVNSVLEKRIIDEGEHTVGYLLFDKFIATSTKELEETFKYFKENGIDSLVIDMRYNGGGLVSVAKDLASLIRTENSSDLLFTLQFNDKNRDRDLEYYFESSSSSLNGIDKVYFLTTEATCSASEAVINGLKPYVAVKVIGSTTCGKPVGMVGGEFCDKYIVPIEFEILNSQKEGRYFDGINPNCYVKDDLNHNLGDENEAMLKEAIAQINGYSCTSNNRKAREIEKQTDSVNMLNSLINSY